MKLPHIMLNPTYRMTFLLHVMINTVTYIKCVITCMNKMFTHQGKTGTRNIEPTIWNGNYISCNDKTVTCNEETVTRNDETVTYNADAPACQRVTSNKAVAAFHNAVFKLMFVFGFSFTLEDRLVRTSGMNLQRRLHW